MMDIVRYFCCVAAFLIICPLISHADMKNLSNEEMGNFVAEEGVCDINLPDGCSQDANVVKTISLTKVKDDKKVTDPLASQIHTIDISPITNAEYNQLNSRAIPFTPSDGIRITDQEVRMTNFMSKVIEDQINNMLPNH